MNLDLFHTLYRPFILGALAVAFITGCAKPEHAPLAYMGPTLRGADLGAPEEATPVNGYAILESNTTRGRFPTGVAVIRLEAAPTEDAEGCGLAGDRGWRVQTLHAQDGVYWNDMLKVEPALRETILLDRRSLVIAEVDSEQMLAAGRRREAGLVLIYGPADAEADHAALVGVLWDVAAKTPIAVMHADAGPEDHKLPQEDRFEDDTRHQDVNFIVARKFERQVRCCLLELLGRDTPSDAVMENPWRAAATQPSDRKIRLFLNQKLPLLQ